MSGFIHLACASLFLAASLAFAWISVADDGAEWAGLLTLGCLLIVGLSLLKVGDVVVAPDYWTDTPGRRG